jgi:tryptophan synthase beta chain
VLHGNRTYLLQDDDGQIIEAHSISAGLDYPGIGPEHSWLHDIGRVEYVSITDKEALDAFQLCTRTEGIIPALEPAHALAHVAKIAPTLPGPDHGLMNLCGRGDKDIFAVAEQPRPCSSIKPLSARPIDGRVRWVPAPTPHGA